MTILEQIERLRQEMVRQIIALTNLPITDIDVTVNFMNQSDESPLAVEARQLNWHPDRHQDSAWYTSEIPTGGSTIIFVE